MEDSYDVVVIGAGSGGMAAAKRAARRGASVAVVEDWTVGGTCVARGCMPKKFLVLAAQKAEHVRAEGPRGLETVVEKLGWSDLIDHERAVVQDLIGLNRQGLEKYDDIDVLEGWATVEQPGRVKVDGEPLAYDHLILAMGLHPSHPPIPGVDNGMDSTEFLREPTLPDSMAIVGGGYISVEFGSVLNAFGVDVTIVQRPDHLIKQHDREIAEQLAAEFEERGIGVNTSCEVDRIEQVEDHYRLHYREDEGGGYLQAERVLIAAGRRPNTGDMGLEVLGVELDEEGFVVVDEYFETSVEDVYAVGDVNRSQQFTPVAIAEGKTAAENAVGDGKRTLNREAIPSAVFSSPPIGSTGLTEREARRTHESVQVATKRFTPFSATVEQRNETTLIKLIYTGEEKRLRGLHLLGPHGPEVVQGFALAIRAGATQEHLKDFPGIHPTVAEEVFSTRPGS